MTRVALVAGAARGIGAAIATRLGAEGWDVAVLDVAPPDATVEAVRAAGGRAAGYVVDVRDWDAVGACVARIEREQGPLHGAVQVAGVWETVDFLDLDPTTWRRVLDINLDGAFHVCRHAAAPMVARGGGAIVCLSSNAATLAWQGGAHYSASKAALLGLVQGMAFELGPRGVRVNAICPGTIRTPATAGELADPAIEAIQARAHVLGRVGEPDDVAHAAAFLLDPVRAAWITGEALLVDGGYGTHGEGADFGAAIMTVPE